MPINVLVYDGPGVSQTSLTHTLFSLRTLLRPNYSVNPITPQALTSDPWPPSCALLVIPGGRDLPYVTALGKANPRIREYVEKGGSFLAFCAGAYYASKRVEWEVGTPLEVKGDRALGFFPGTAKGCAYKGFVYESEDGARAISVKVNENDGSTKTYEGIYYNGGGMFVEAEKFQPQGVRVLATYADGEHSGEPAAVVCDVGEGRAILWGPHPEYPLDRQPAAAALEKDASRPQESQITLLESSRWALLKSTLELLGLRVPLKSTEDASKDSVGPLPQILVVAPTKPFIMTHFREAEVRIVGITSDYGLLRTVPVGDEIRFGADRYIDLQPDGNSFDMMAGLIRLKS
ncbi:biotin holocarboxylase synthetase [Tulasnella sp. 403]|nr:biotin holocarboxylase synthetase [Tulasnella sp. 403]